MVRFEQGDTIGRYEIVRSLGAGGMASTWLAVTPDGDTVVLKMPHQAEPELIERFRDEARVGVRVSHPNLVDTLDLVEHGGLPVLILRFIDGASIRELTRASPLSASATAFAGAQIAGALAALHEAVDEAGRPLHIVHRDVSPANVLVSRDGSAHLIDLGIARSSEALHQTRTGALLGTLPNMAPEIFADENHTRASDVWALGCVLFGAVSGEPLFGGKNPGALVLSVMDFDPQLTDDPRWAAIDRPLREVLARALCPDPSKRISDCGLLADLLMDFVGDEEAAKAELAAGVRHALGDKTRTFRITSSFYFPEEDRQAVTRVQGTGDWVDAFEEGIGPSEEPAAGFEEEQPTVADDGIISRSRATSVIAPPAAREPAPDSWPGAAPDAAAPAAPPSWPGADRAAAPAPHLDDAAFRPPAAAPVSIELARPVGSGEPVHEYVPEPAVYAAQAPKRRRGLRVVVTAGIAVGLTASLLYIFGWLPTGTGGSDKRAGAAGPSPDTAAESSLLSAPANAPDCYTGAVGEYYLYGDGRGTQIVKDDLRDVPKARRRSARCVTAAR